MSSALAQLRAGAVCGRFRLRQCTEALTRDGFPYLKLVLEDFSGQLTGYIWQQALVAQVQRQRLSSYTLVTVQGQARWFQGRLRLDVSSLLMPGAEEGSEVLGAEGFCAARLLPRSLCPLPDLLALLVAAVEQIALPALRRFVEAVLLDKGISFAFVAAPASLRHHHSYPGGLLQHSLECFVLVSRHQEFPRERAQLGMVAALFHDIGKVLTLTHHMRRTSLGACLDHDKLTLEVLAPHLRQLDRDWPEGGEELRYLLTWKLCSRVPRYDMADLVACCDRLSTGLNHRAPHHGSRSSAQPGVEAWLALRRG
ncbi:HD domain-containing protein [Desulfuromonas thiophila]|uniref:HD domain-containing protein n=1 Tax=Desulfuromonas thiophila TaxID=57664 RepID=UPI0024A8B2ED|nr:TraI domain-containing protein [Desulfuromonas thiophila]